MSSPLVFSAIKTHTENKEIEKDANGYYKVILGALNSFNSVGAFYVDDGVKDLVNNQSQLLTRRLSKGYLNGEMGHPQLQPGMNMQAFIMRNMKIDPANISHHIKEIMFTPTNESSGLPSKGNMILIEGWVKPTGPKGEYLKQALDNPDQNVAFSIRALTEDKYVGGVLIKKIAQIITWDWVVEPGISKANKWDKLSMESLDICRVDVNELMLIAEEYEKVAVTHESRDITDSIKDVCNKYKSENNSYDVFMKW